MDYFRAMALLTVTGISKEVKGSFTVRNIHFTQQPFQNIAVAGETGSGKTTLLKMIAGLTEPTAGEIQFEHKKITGPNDQLIPGHPGIAYLSQYFELRNNYWVYEVLEMANKLTEKEAKTLYSVCQIEHLLQRRTDQLSGGEKQRIALARLLTSSPRLLLLDEPFSNLDAVHKSTIKSVIHDIGEKLNITCMMVLHDAADILSWADTILVMKDGRIIQQGTPQQVYGQPVNEYCAALFGEYNLIDVSNASFFATVPGIVLNGKQLLIRPEHFSIAATEENAVKGTVKNSLFRGSYYTSDVMINEQMLRVRTGNRQFETGSTIYLSVIVEQLWYI